MEVVELDNAIDELETRVERLRSLFEQYFMGIEKIPPAVAQKDVDRRVYLLRREQIRNTARRFKLQTIIQRYNTYQQYWLRIMREIENGTYRRHVLRAERTVGVTSLLTAAERKRLGLPDAVPTANETETPQREALTDTSTTEDAAPVTTRSLSSLAPPAPLSPAEIRTQIERDLGLLLDDDELSSLKKFDIGKELDDPLLSSLPPAPRRRKPSIRASRRNDGPASSSRRSAPVKPNSVPESQRTALGLGPVTPRQFSSSRATKSESIRPDRVVSIDAKASIPEPVSAPLASPKTRLDESASANRAALPTGPTRGLRLPAQSAVAGRGLPPAPKTVTVVRPQETPSHLATTPTEDPPKPPKPDSAPRGLPNVRESIPPNSTRPASTPNPAFSPRAPVSQPPKHHRTPEQKPLKPAPILNSDVSSALDRVSVERLADKLRNARKQTQEEVPVFVDALAKKLEATKADLQKKYLGKRIDFDVVIKDGKAIVKPIVR